MVQWLEIHLPMQKTWVQSLVWEDPTCCRTTKPTHHNYGACALGPGSCNYGACVQQYCDSLFLEPVLCNKRSHCNEKPVQQTAEKACKAVKTQHSQK